MIIYPLLRGSSDPITHARSITQSHRPITVLYQLFFLRGNFPFIPHSSGHPAVRFRFLLRADQSAPLCSCRQSIHLFPLSSPSVPSIPSFSLPNRGLSQNVVPLNLRPWGRGEPNPNSSVDFMSVDVYVVWNGVMLTVKAALPHVQSRYHMSILPMILGSCRMSHLYGSFRRQPWCSVSRKGSVRRPQTLHEGAIITSGVTSSDSYHVW